MLIGVTILAIVAIIEGITLLTFLAGVILFIISVKKSKNKSSKNKFWNIMKIVSLCLSLTCLIIFITISMFMRHI